MKGVGTEPGDRAHLGRATLELWSTDEGFWYWRWDELETSRPFAFLGEAILDAVAMRYADTFDGRLTRYLDQDLRGRVNQTSFSPVVVWQRLSSGSQFSPKAKIGNQKETKYRSAEGEPHLMMNDRVSPVDM